MSVNRSVTVPNSRDGISANDLGRDVLERKRLTSVASSFELSVGTRSKPLLECRQVAPPRAAGDEGACVLDSCPNSTGVRRSAFEGKRERVLTQVPGESHPITDLHGEVDRLGEKRRRFLGSSPCERDVRKRSERSRAPPPPADVLRKGCALFEQRNSCFDVTALQCNRTEKRQRLARTLVVRKPTVDLQGSLGAF